MKRKKDNSPSDWIRLGFDAVVDITDIPYFKREEEWSRLAGSEYSLQIVVVSDTWEKVEMRRSEVSND